MRKKTGVSLSKVPKRIVLLSVMIVLMGVISLIMFLTAPKQPQKTIRAAATQASIVINHTNASATDISQTMLDSARKLKVIFNHQSVGYNILSGLDHLASQNASRYTVKRSNFPLAAWYKTNAGVGDFTQGYNGDPVSKVNGFNALIRNGYGDQVQVAMMKFCYVDFGDATTAWNAYSAAMKALIKDYPKVKFVWWTSPVMTSDGGNAQRAAFNKLVRQYVTANGGILFDLADIESHDPSGKAIVTSGNEAMYSGYSLDGGHLNTIGSDRVASAWWKLMATIATPPVTPTATPAPQPSLPKAVPSLSCIGSCATNTPAPSLTATPSGQPQLSPTLAPCQEGTHAATFQTPAVAPRIGIWQGILGWFSSFANLFFHVPTHTSVASPADECAGLDLTTDGGNCGLNKQGVGLFCGGNCGVKGAANTLYQCKGKVKIGVQQCSSLCITCTGKNRADQCGTSTKSCGPGATSASIGGMDITPTETPPITPVPTLAVPCVTSTPTPSATSTP